MLLAALMVGSAVIMRCNMCFDFDYRYRLILLANPRFRRPETLSLAAARNGEVAEGVIVATKVGGAMSEGCALESTIAVKLLANRIAG